VAVAEIDLDTGRRLKAPANQVDLKGIVDNHNEGMTTLLIQRDFVR